MTTKRSQTRQQRKAVATVHAVALMVVAAVALQSRSTCAFTSPRFGPAAGISLVASKSARHRYTKTQTLPSSPILSSRSVQDNNNNKEGFVFLDSSESSSTTTATSAASSAPSLETMAAASDAAAMVFSMKTPEEVGLESRPSQVTTTLEASDDSELLLHEQRRNDHLNLQQQEKESTSALVPSYRKLATFTATTILIWLSEPLLSLVDTTVVGLQPNAILPLAAVGPATTLYDSAVYLCYFLAMAATNQLTEAKAQGDVRSLQRHTSHIVGVAALLGTAVSTLLVAAGPRLLAGGGGAAAWLPLATQYTQIRGMVAVFAIMGSVLQAFCLALQNTTTPFVAVVAAAVTNTVGDLLLAPRFGLAGVAAATATSTVVSTAILFRSVVKQMKSWRKQEREEEKQLDKSSNSETPVQQLLDEMEPSENVLAMSKESDEASKRPVPFLSIPDRKSMLQLVKLAGPLFFVYVAKTVCYSAMTIRCTSLGNVPLASHSILMRIFFFFACFGDSLSQTAQSFLPATLYPRYQPAAYRKVMQRLAVIAGVFGFMHGQGIVTILKHCTRFLTKDAAIVATMTHPAALACVGAAVWMHPAIMMLEGTTVARRQFKQLTSAYATTLALHLGLLVTTGKSFTAIWRVFAIFQATRLAQYAGSGILEAIRGRKAKNATAGALQQQQVAMQHS